MGWKGTVRSIGAAVRAAERDARRRQKELERRTKQYEKMQELERAAYEVDVFENHIDVIQSIHKECSEPIDWEAVSKSAEPSEPSKSDKNEKKARIEQKNYRPSLIDRLFKKIEKKKALLANAIEQAIELDVKEYNEKLSSWKKEVNDWEETVAISKSLLEGNVKAKLEAIENLDPFSEISNLGSSLSITAGENGILDVTIHVHGEEIVPSEEKNLLKSGKLSVKKMPKGRFNEIYQDYVCSAALRVANEMFSVLPDDRVIVTAVDNLLNSSTGHLEETPILSVCVSRSTLRSLNLSAIDPSDAMSKFVHNMDFKKTKGFGAVSRVML